MTSSTAAIRSDPQRQLPALLADYRPGSFFYASPHASLLAEGVHATVRCDRAGGYAEPVRTALSAAAADGVATPMVVGAVGFHPDTPARLVVPDTVHRGDRLPLGPARHGDETEADDWSVRARPAADGYTDGVRRALNLIDGGALRKVVLARSLELTTARRIEIVDLIARLAAADPDSHTFAADVTGEADPTRRTLIGASPELLISRSGHTVVANPLAGSAPRSADPVEDRRRGDELLASAKNLAEHAIVTREVARVLAGYCDRLAMPARPVLVRTATMWHLSTRVTGRLRDPATSSLAVAEALHPTPAVCGVPPAAARDAIGDLESFDRDYYTGLVGWCTADGDGTWVVTIRCAEIAGPRLRLFAGAGVVRGSEPESELAETSAKFRTLLSAIGLRAAL